MLRSEVSTISGELQFDVPKGLVADNDADGMRQLYIRVQRYRRVNGGPFQLVPVVADLIGNGLQVGWGHYTGNLADPIPIKILDDPTQSDGSPEDSVNALGPTPRDGWGLAGFCEAFGCFQIMGTASGFDSLAPDYVPLPTASISFPALQLPAAWEFEIEYPAQRMSIVGVSLQGRKPSEAFLNWSVLEPTPNNDCTPRTGTLRLQIVDPKRLARGINVAFKLVHTESGNCRAPIASADLVVKTAKAKAYNIDGALMTWPNLTKTLEGGL